MTTGEYEAVGSSRLKLGKKMPELHYITPEAKYGGETTTILDPDSPENLRRNLAALTPMQRYVLAAYIDTVQATLEEIEVTP